MMNYVMHYKKTDLTKKRSIAKIGMTVSLGTLVATGLMSTRRAKAIHIVSGVAMVGFSYWHYTLYQNSNRN